jgi:hypothetical protein
VAAPSKAVLLEKFMTSINKQETLGAQTACAGHEGQAVLSRLLGSKIDTVMASVESTRDALKAKFAESEPVRPDPAEEARSPGQISAALLAAQAALGTAGAGDSNVLIAVIQDLSGENPRSAGMQAVSLLEAQYVVAKAIAIGDYGTEAMAALQMANRDLAALVKAAAQASIAEQANWPAPSGLVKSTGEISADLLEAQAALGAQGGVGAQALTEVLLDLSGERLSSVGVQAANLLNAQASLAMAIDTGAYGAASLTALQTAREDVNALIAAAMAPVPTVSKVIENQLPVLENRSHVDRHHHHHHHRRWHAAGH